MPHMCIFTFLHIKNWNAYETVPWANEELQTILSSVAAEKAESQQPTN